MKSVVITGATGSIGRPLVDVVIEAGYEVLAVIHRTSTRAEELKKKSHCHVLMLDLSEYDYAMEELSQQGISHDENYKIFFHLAWMASFGKDRDNLDLQLDNVKASLAAVKFAKELGCETFVGTGSQAEYGNVTSVLSPDTPTFPETGYGIAKLCAGQLTRLSCKQIGIKHEWCRILSAYGPYDREQTIISTAVSRMMKNEETEFSQCDQIWDYIYSEDAARAILLIGQRGVNEKVYVIGSGNSRPLKEYIKRIAEITGYKGEIGFGKRPYNDNQVMCLRSDISELKDIGFFPEISFDEGIKRIIDSIRL